MKDWREECAVCGVWGDPESARMTYLGLYAQQHRGQEATGIVCLDSKGRHKHHKGQGLVGDVYPAEALDGLDGNSAIGHCRYSTMGGNSVVNIQPLTAHLMHGPMAIAHNGNIVNAAELKRDLIKEGAIFQGSNDTEVLLHLLARWPGDDIVEGLKHCLPKLKGAFSLVILTKHGLIAARDSHGFRPLVLGRRSLNQGFSYVVASETCALDLIGAKFVREIEPGEILSFTDEGQVKTSFAPPAEKLAKCVFELVYFSRPDSLTFGTSVYEARKRMGQRLSHESPVEADLVVPVPDSGVPAALGYSQESGIPFEWGIIRNHYIGRTFIQPSQSIREFGVKIKLNPQAAVLKGKRVIIVDDSLVRGTTSRKIIRLVRAAGATEVHFRLACPPTTGSCYYGVDTPHKSQLIASRYGIEEIRQFIGADTLSYLSTSGLMDSVGDKAESHKGFCAACFDGKYPVAFDDKGKAAME